LPKKFSLQAVTEDFLKNNEKFHIGTKHYFFVSFPKITGASSAG
jgi:hypothetical protein